MVDPFPNYLQLVTGLSKATRARARSAARSLLSQVGLDEVADDASERISRLTEEIQAAGRANREMLENLIANEVERAADRLGFARKDDIETVRAEVAVLRTMIQLQTPSPAAATTPVKTPVAKAPAKKAPAKQAPAKKAPAKTTAAKTTAAKTTAAKTTAAKKTAARKTAATTEPTGAETPA